MSKLAWSRLLIFVNLLIKLNNYSQYVYIFIHYTIKKLYITIISEGAII